ncbi:HaeII family restriction endonuclease [Prevotella denticola]|uniref:HaeII family restriction endonuclease n=1 Tax=Prevotella denticola TaxID=28129 RepID=UPI0028E83824|nr:HaeII family restriction endonuclease [Prevotella denticola]
MKTREEAKSALDTLIRKSRVHWYKPIQIAEILYHHRVDKDIDLSKLEDYRTKSKKWRDTMSLSLLGRRCTSSARFQDNLFDDNAIPPEILVTLGYENVKYNGAVESYIYASFTKKHLQLSNALEYCMVATTESFKVEELINLFWNEPGLRRSIDKVYEIIVYSLFSTLVDALNLKVEISVAETALPLLKEFEDFSTKIMCLDANNTRYVQEAKVYRVGVTNAADRGLDMYSNWGPAIQIKHLSLNEDLAETIVNGVSSDRIVIVCKDAEEKTIISLLNQIGWKSKIQNIVTEKELIKWYKKALTGTYSALLASKLLNTLSEEMLLEFPSLDTLPDALTQRHYEKISNDFWQ